MGRDGRGLHERRRSDKVDYPGEGEEALSTPDPIRGANSLSSLRHIPARQKAVEEADNVHVWA